MSRLKAIQYDIIKDIANEKANYEIKYNSRPNQIAISKYIENELKSIMLQYFAEPYNKKSMIYGLEIKVDKDLKDDEFYIEHRMKDE